MKFTPGAAMCMSRILNAIAVSPPIYSEMGSIFQRKLTAAHTTVATTPPLMNSHRHDGA